MCDRHWTGLKDAAEEKGPIPPWSPRPRNAHEGLWNGLNPAGYKLVRRVPHARKGLALDRNETLAQRNTRSVSKESICDLFDDVTDLGAPSSPAPSAHRFAAAGLDRAPRSVTSEAIKIAKHRNIPLTAASSYKSSHCCSHIQRRGGRPRFLTNIGLALTATK
jgi:hypothetical protein